MKRWKTVPFMNFAVQLLHGCVRWTPDEGVRLPRRPRVCAPSAFPMLLCIPALLGVAILQCVMLQPVTVFAQAVATPLLGHATAPSGLALPAAGVTARQEQTGSVRALPAEPRTLPATGPLRVCARNPRYFTDGSGKAIYLTAAHTWTNLPDIGLTDPPPAFDFDGYLNFLTQHNYNYIRLWRWETPKDIEKDGVVRYSAPHPWKRTGPGTAWDGKPKFDLNTFDEEYFARMRKRVEAAGDRGIYVSVMLFDGWELQFSNWTGHPFNRDNNINGINGDTDGDGRGIEIQMWPLAAPVERDERNHHLQTVSAGIGLHVGAR